MIARNFKTFEKAAQFYKACQRAPLPVELKTQLLRSSSSVALNLAEGRGKPTLRDQLRFFHIAMGSLRESQAVLTLASLEGDSLWHLADQVGASLYRLIERAR